MNIEYKPEVDALYIRIAKRSAPVIAARTGACPMTLMVDLDRFGNACGIEILGLSQSCVGQLLIAALTDKGKEHTIHGKAISREEALKGLGDPKTWSRDKKKLMAKFREQTKSSQRRSARSKK